MKKYNRLFGFLVLVFFIFLIIYSLKSFYKELNNELKSKSNRNQYRLACKKFNKEKYNRECFNLITELRNPNPNLFFNPPLDHIPKSMFNEFTQYGEMPLSKLWYFNEPYYDLSNNYSTKKEIITKAQVDYFRINNGKKRPENNYGDWYNHFYMKKYSKYIINRSFMVFGSMKPWLEAIALDNGASKVFTLDYIRKAYEENDLLEWWHVNDYLDLLSNSRNLEQFNNAASFSFIEHLGLGRYGDPLDPLGDLKALNLVHCMIKPRGFLFLGLPTSLDNSSHIYFNAYRVYGQKRLEKLFSDKWHLVEQTNNKESHSVFILKKKYSYIC